MRHQIGAIGVPDADRSAGGRAAAAARPADAHINPATGLATDYLNHFNEAIMLLDMVADCPECRDDLRAWQRRSYREHFRQSGLKASDVAIAAYDTADPVARDMLDALAGTMTTVIEHARTRLDGEADAKRAGIIADRATAWLRLLVAQAGAVINNQHLAASGAPPQDAIDRAMKVAG
ncbi:MAG: hypothetical protein KIT48_20605 [Pseudolabrys sp.]|jgi:hypothetical protein|nr:hypothetical protein [Pseudolabrys sp.]